MGLFDRLRGIADPVQGTYQLTSCSMNTGGAVYQNCAMEGVVSGPGVTPTAVQHSTLAAPTAKWPDPGDTLPVTFDRQRPDRLKIDWDRMPTNRDRAAYQAQQQAQQMAALQAAQQNPGTPNSPGAGYPGGPYQSGPYPGGPGSGAPGAGQGDPFAGLPPQMQTQLRGFLGGMQGAGARITTTVNGQVVGDSARAVPGAPGGGLTPAETQQAMTPAGAAALGLAPTTARVIAAHEVQVPAGMPTGPGGVWDLTLDVAPTPGSAAGYSSVLRVNFSSPERRGQVGAVGRDLPVLADPTRHDRIAIDTSRLT